ncbi:T9SS_type A sorting domain-containing protein [Hexamita inflata]|uniref:T9SS type A sorting domain-containing protein n=1 Tax=Hexamita inflata TaxID=28002 RepID=A0AA86PAT1_9EUKA|nr:T9SS type A sorting domain-containing protein [Hexamita inflata]
MNSKTMTNEFKCIIRDGILNLMKFKKLENIQIINTFNIQELIIDTCQNIIPKFKSSIRKLTIIDCGIKSLNEMDLPNIQALDLRDNDESAVNELSGPYLNIQYLSLTKYTNLELNNILKFKQLTRLRLAICGLTNIQQLKEFLYLTDLDLQDNENIDISPLKQMKQLNKLNLSGCYLKNINVIQYLVQLKELNLEGNTGEKYAGIDVNPLQNLKQLEKLNLKCCLLIDVTALSYLSSLKELNLALNNIIYLKPLKDLKHLKQLDAQFNKILDVQELKKHKNFRSFLLSGQKQCTQKEVTLASKIRSINQFVTKLRIIKQKCIEHNSKYVFKMKQVNQYLHQCGNNQYHSTAKVASLFQKIILDDCYQ